MLGPKGAGSGLDCWITSDGQVYAAQLMEGEEEHPHHLVDGYESPVDEVQTSCLLPAYNRTHLYTAIEVRAWAY